MSTSTFTVGCWVGLLTCAAQAIGCAAAGGMSVDDGGRCSENAQPISDEEPQPGLGFSPADILAWTEGSRLSTAVWGPAGPAAHGLTKLMLVINRGSGAKRSVREQCGAELLVRIPATLELTTDDGVLEQSFTGQLAATQKGFATFDAQFTRMEDLKPFADSASSPNSELDSIRLHVALTPDGSKGSLDPLVLRERTSEELTPPIMRWPSENACEHDAVPRSISPQDSEWLAAIRDSIARPWKGTRDGVQMDDVQLRLGSYACEHEDAGLGAPATLSMPLTESGTPVEFSGEFKLEGSAANFELSSSGSPAELTMLYGNLGTDLSQFDIVELRVKLTVATETPEGLVTLVGFVNQCESCDSGASCPACAGSQETNIFQIPLHPQ